MDICNLLLDVSIYRLYIIYVCADMLFILNFFHSRISCYLGHGRTLRQQYIGRINLGRIDIPSLTCNAEDNTVTATE